MAKLVCYRPDMPWLVVVPAPLISFGLGGLFTLVPAMIADVVDVDELEDHLRDQIAALGDAVVDASIAALREKLAALAPAVPAPAVGLSMTIMVPLSPRIYPGADRPPESWTESP